MAPLPSGLPGLELAARMLPPPSRPNAPQAAWSVSWSAPVSEAQPPESAGPRAASRAAVGPADPATGASAGAVA